jgi:hypothetical protein
MNSGFSLTRFFAAFILSLVLIVATGLLLDRDHFRFALAGGKFSASEEALIKETVKHFNSLVADLSASMGKTNSDDLPATKPMRHKLYMDTGVSAMAKQVLVYDLASLDILSVKWQDPRTAIVRTKEAWNYQYRNAENKAELDIIKGMDDEFRYVLLKQKGKWLVHRSSGLLKELKHAK